MGFSDKRLLETLCLLLCVALASDSAEVGKCHPEPARPPRSAARSWHVVTSAVSPGRGADACGGTRVTVHGGAKLSPPVFSDTGNNVAGPGAVLANTRASRAGCVPLAGARARPHRWSVSADAPRARRRQLPPCTFAVSVCVCDCACHLRGRSEAPGVRKRRLPSALHEVSAHRTGSTSALGEAEEHVMPVRRPWGCGGHW